MCSASTEKTLSVADTNPLCYTTEVSYLQNRNLYNLPHMRGVDGSEEEEEKEETEKTFPVIYFSLWPYSTTFVSDAYINPTGRPECLIYKGGGSDMLKYNL